MTLLCGTARKPLPRFLCCPPTGHLRPCYRRPGSCLRVFVHCSFPSPRVALSRVGSAKGLLALPCLFDLFSPMQFSRSCLLTGFTGWQASAVARASQFFLCGRVTSHNRAALGEVNASVPTFLKKQSLMRLQSVSTLSIFIFPGIDGTPCARHSGGGAKKDCYHSFLVTVVIISHSEIAHTLVTVPHFPLPLFFFLPAISKPSFLSFYTSTFSGKHAFVWQVFFF